MPQGDYEFFKYIAKFGKTYATTQEMEFRKEVFKKNLEYIATKNSQNDLTYSLALNKFADMTNEEFRQRLGRKKNTALRSSNDYKILDDSNLPEFVDWRAKGGVNWV